MYTLIQTPGGGRGGAAVMSISIVLALVSLLVSEWLARLSRERMEISMLELNFTQTLETIP